MFFCRYAEISGFHGVVAGMLVAVKQLTPDTEITVVQIVKLRAKVRHLPAGRTWLRFKCISTAHSQ